MLKNISLSLALGLFCLPGLAQNSTKPDTSTASRGDVAVGYSYLDLSNNGQSQSFNGVSFSGAYDITHWIAAAADFDFAHANVSGASVNVQSYTFGPRIYRQMGRYMPFGEFMLGDGRVSASVSGTSGSQNDFAFNMLGGVDIGLDKRGKWAVRPEVAYLHVNSNPSTNGVHIGAGVAYHF